MIQSKYTSQTNTQNVSGCNLISHFLSWFAQGCFGSVEWLVRKMKIFTCDKMTEAYWYFLLKRIFFGVPLYDWYKNKACYYEPSASRAMSCRRPVVPRSMPVLSSSSLSRNELAVDESERSVTCPTFIGRPASSKPFSCSRAFFAHSASANFKKQRRLESNYLQTPEHWQWHCWFYYRYEAISFGSSSLTVHH